MAQTNSLKNFWNNNLPTFKLIGLISAALVVGAICWIGYDYFFSEKETKVTTTVVAKKHTERNKPKIRLKIKTPPLTPAGQQAVEELTKEVKALKQTIDTLLNNKAKADSTKKASAPLHAKLHSRKRSHYYHRMAQVSCCQAHSTVLHHYFDRRQY